MGAINCLNQAKNTGQACVPQFKVLNNFIAVYTYANDGTRNEIDITVNLDQTYFDSMINHIDPSKRWYPLAPMKNILSDRADSLFETFDDGSKIRINQGVKAMAGVIVSPQFNSPQYYGKLISYNGTDISVFGVDKSKNLLCKEGSDATHLAPVRLDSGSIDAKWVSVNDKASQKIMLMWDYDQLENDSKLRIIEATEMSADVSALRGLIDVTGIVSNITTTGLEITLRTDAGTPINPVDVSGLLPVNFVSSTTAATGKVRDVTDGSDLAVTVVESPDGHYALTWPAESSADVIIVKPKLNGYDFSAVEALSIVIP